MVNQPGNDFDDESSTLDLFGRPRRTGPLGTGGNVPVAPNAGILNRNTASSPTEGVELQRFTVTNPDKSVSVSALLDGRIDRVTVPRRAARMTESGLSDEIMTLAQVAMQKARSALYLRILHSVGEMGRGDKDYDDMLHRLKTSLNLPTPEEAAAAEADLVANRYPRQWMTGTASSAVGTDSWT
ncbi:hypothetical protein [Mycobacterium kansasii]|uniref:hypothetical protein n=1 Tax=Mycobacterium kansasii TaxID=1768 RepID=UPI0009EF7064|nr:hypothetical protein [Mycobacterium kansasii]ARG94342.1 hypothetical protein B1T50_23095 [Mycobacterium kansasii]